MFLYVVLPENRSASGLRNSSELIEIISQFTMAANDYSMEIKTRNAVNSIIQLLSCPLRAKLSDHTWINH